jgi:lysophospholipase L1-like esterase
VAKWVGLDPRIPTGELSARARWIADDVLDLTIARMAERTRARGARLVMLALNGVIDDEQPEVTHRATIERAGIPLIDLIGIFPEADRSHLRVAPWDDHPNAEGHRLIAARFYDQLVPILDAMAGAASPTTN